MREADERYFDRLERRLEAAIDVAERAKRRGGDPEPEVEIPVAKDMADRVENILGIDGVAERVRELEGRMSREEAALELVTDFVEGSVGDYDSRAGKIEGAVRTAVALLTEGVVAAPIEGIDRVEVLENDDGTEFVNVYYAGPIRSAGGTAQALSVLVADYARSLLGIEEYRAREAEVERYAEEVALYDTETGLQYTPTTAETRFVAQHMPIMLDGEATGDEEVSGYRDLERVDTNAARGGMCLVLAEGIALKAPKIQRYTGDLDAVDWPWLQDLIDGAVGTDDGSDGGADADADDDGSDGETNEDDGDEDESGRPGPPRVDPSKKFLRDLIAGRPVFAHPSAPGGFRLRYGRARNHGFATAGVHPATMHLVDDFLATGTQIKTERPGKAAGVVPVDSIEGPTVRLANGDVRRIDDPEEALEVRNGVETILDLGEYLVNYGEFVENNHPLAPAAYAVEWWIQDFAAAGADVQAMRDDPGIDLADPGADEALAWAREYDAPLHPAYTYCWHDVSVDAVVALADAVEDARIVGTDGARTRPDEEHSGDDGDRGPGSDRRPEPRESDLAIPRSEPVRRTLETLLVEHHQDEDWLRVADWRPLVASLGFDPDTLERGWDGPDALPAAARTFDDGDNAIAAVRAVADFDVRERAPTRVGNRMGRPEKSESRELSPAVHTLFPIGEAGGAQRDVAAAASHAEDMQSTPGVIEARVGRRECLDCGDHTFEARCPDCGGRTRPDYECPDCGRSLAPDESGRVWCRACDVAGTCVEPTTIDLDEQYRSALSAVGERETAFEILKGVKGLSSAEKTPEPIEKGILRAKHGVSVFKDGTVRYDMTDLPVTAVRPAELDVTARDFRGLGYETDVHGEPLRHDDQLVELNVQDVVLSDGAAEHMLKTAGFVDDLLVEYYGLDPFYELEERDDLIGELVFGMAPHTSAATVGRVIGFTEAAVGYAHPYFHAAKRRNCDGDEDCVMLLMDGLLNFSKCYLPDKRGGSVAEDSRLVAVDPDGKLRFVTFEEFWDELESPLEVDGKFRKRACYGEGWRTFAFDGNHEASLQPIEKAIRYRADEDERLFRIETQCGRSLEITANHSLFRYDGTNGIGEVAGDDLEEGDLLLAPRRLDVEPRETTIDVADCLEEPSVVIDDHVEDLLATARELGDTGGPERAAFDAGRSQPPPLDTLDHRLSKTTIPLATLEAIVDTCGLEGVPREVKIGRQGSTDGIDRTVDIDEEFAWLLGLYVAEGSASSACPSITTSEREIVDGVCETAESSLGREPDVRWSKGSYEIGLPAVFRDVLEHLGVERCEPCGAGEKVIPEQILRAPRAVVVAFLRGLAAVDGNESSDDATTVGFQTESEDLTDGLVFLLHRLGLVATVSKRSNHEGDRGDVYTVTVSGTASDDPLRRILDDGDPARQKSLVVEVPDALMAVREMDIEDIERIVPESLSRREDVSLEDLRERVAEIESRDLPDAAVERLAEVRPLVEGDLSYLRVETVERIDYDGYLYDLQVGGEPIFLANWLYAHNSMDAPLVMSSRIDPSEIDDEAHNVDVMSRYPREFYEATREMADPDAVADVMTIAEQRLGTDREYADFAHTHDTTDIHQGPSLSAYKTLGSMQEKMDAQLELSRKLRAVDETDVAERIIEYHFLPDLIGNLRAFARQETRCLDCGRKYRRMPLTGDCRECGGDVTLTVHEGSVTKYLDTAVQVAEEFGVRDYTRQRLEMLERSIERTFEDDTHRQTGIAEFM